MYVCTHNIHDAWCQIIVSLFAKQQCNNNTNNEGRRIFSSLSFSFTMRKQTFGLLKFELHCFLPCNNFHIRSLVETTGAALVSKHNVTAADPNPRLVCLQSRLERRLTAAARANKAKNGRGGKGEKTREFNLDILKVRVRGAVHVYKGEGLWVSWEWRACVRVGKWSRPIERQLRASWRNGQQLWSGWLQLRILWKPSDIADWWKSSFWRWWIGYLIESNQTSEPSTRMNFTSSGQPISGRQR